MSKALQLFVTAFVCLALGGQTFGQNNFTWQNQSLGGGGFCQEIRFDPYHLIGNPFGTPHLYLATVPDANLTTIAFNVPNTRS